MNMENNTKQGKKVTIFAFILSFISIGILIFGFTLVSSDKVVMLQSISNLYNKLSKTSNDDYALLDKIATSKDIGIKNTITLSQNKNSYSITTDYLENKEDKKSELDLSIKQNEKELLNGSLALSDSKLYAFIKDITPKYYYTSFDFISIIKSLSSSDFDKIKAILKESISDSINNNDIKKEKVTIQYNGKDKKVNKLSLSITNKTVEKLVTTFIKELKKDKKLCSNIASLIGITSEELLEQIDVYAALIQSDTTIEVFKYQTYYYGFNKIIMYEFVAPDELLKLQYKVDTEEIINVYIADYNYLSLEISKDKEGYSYKGTVNDPTTLNKYEFNGTYKNNTLTISYEQDGITYKAIIVSTNSSKENSYINNTKVTLKTETNNQENNIVVIESNTEYYFNKKVDLSLKDSTDIKNISEADIELIGENFKASSLYKSLEEYSKNLKNIELQSNPLLENVL